MMWIPLFAEDTVGPGGWVAVAIAVITAGSTALLAIINARHKNKAERESTAIAQWKEYTDRLELHITRQDEKMNRVVEDVARCRVAELAAREEVAELRAGQTILYDFCFRMHGECIKAGIKVPSMPPAPINRPLKAAIVEATFAVSSERHERNLIQKESGEIEKPSDKPPSPP